MQVLNKNKESAIAFYRMAFLGEPAKAVELFVGDQYIQHNADVPDGKQGFIDYFDKMHREYPNKDIRFLRSISQDDLVALHTHQTWPENDQYVTMDFFRFDKNGKIVEHWDAMQQLPHKMAHDNGMF